MTDPAAAEEKRRMHELESKFLSFALIVTQILEEINRGEIPKPMMIKTDSHGDK